MVVAQYFIAGLARDGKNYKEIKVTVGAAFWGKEL
jgi:hypothetical protein